jgi:ATP:corrinoid adenosyltransferase
MDIVAALRQEEEKWEKQAEEARQQLETVRAAIKLFRGETTGKRTSALGSSVKTTGGKKRVMSAAARAKMAQAQKERWAKFRAAKAKGKQ